MRYHVRQRGKDDVIGPFSVEEIMGRVRAGQLNPWDMVLSDSAQTSEQLRNDSDFKWEPLEGLLTTARTAQRSPSISRNAAMEEHLQARSVKKSAANWMLLIGALALMGGIAVAVLSYQAADAGTPYGSLRLTMALIGTGLYFLLHGLFSR